MQLRRKVVNLISKTAAATAVMLCFAGSAMAQIATIESKTCGIPTSIKIGEGTGPLLNEFLFPAADLIECFQAKNANDENVAFPLADALFAPIGGGATYIQGTGILTVTDVENFDGIRVTDNGVNALTPAATLDRSMTAEKGNISIVFNDSLTLRDLRATAAATANDVAARRATRLTNAGDTLGRVEVQYASYPAAGRDIEAHVFKFLKAGNFTVGEDNEPFLLNDSWFDVSNANTGTAPLNVDLDAIQELGPQAAAAHALTANLLVEFELKPEVKNIWNITGLGTETPNEDKAFVYLRPTVLPVITASSAVSGATVAWTLKVDVPVQNSAILYTLSGSTANPPTWTSQLSLGSFGIQSGATSLPAGVHVIDSLRSRPTTTTVLVPIGGTPTTAVIGGENGVPAAGLPIGFTNVIPVNQVNGAIDDITVTPHATAANYAVAKGDIKLGPEENNIIVKTIRYNDSLRIDSTNIRAMLAPYRGQGTITFADLTTTPGTITAYNPATRFIVGGGNSVVTIAGANFGTGTGTDVERARIRVWPTNADDARARDSLALSGLVRFRLAPNLPADEVEPFTIAVVHAKGFTNYNDAIILVQVRITERTPLNATMQPFASITFGQELGTPLATLDPDQELSDGTFIYTFTGTRNNGTGGIGDIYSTTQTPPTHAGEYTVIANLDSENYFATASQKFVISPKPVIVTFAKDDDGDWNVVYQGWEGDDNEEDLIKDLAEGTEAGDWLVFMTDGFAKLRNPVDLPGQPTEWVPAASNYFLAHVGVNTPVLEVAREVPATETPEIAVTAPKGASVSVTVGPNPAAVGSNVTIFADAAVKGTLTVFDASGNVVTRIAVDGTEATWNLRDARGRAVAEGTYLVRGALKTAAGNTVRVSNLVGVSK